MGRTRQSVPLLIVTGKSDIGVIFEGKNLSKEETAGFVISGSPKTLSGLNTVGFWVGEMQGSSVCVVSVFEETGSTFLTLSGGQSLCICVKVTE